ncbi:gas vesicle protein GvpJ [Thermomonospora umbrina]|uniref:Gas vesicle protein A n=1 Tax=Thermomonospora umbrina TaxID=111806 RepID=A0A3D9SIQ0_9ACTN|nr:gas vesicle protein GvpJ [Thermomonospora umbrina]REE95779.1 gas vesicle protein GvpA/GvpJ/GvpM family [Thermomonospora umbrina]
MPPATVQRQGPSVERPSSSGLADVVEMILDKGLVIDAYVRVSLVGIELLTVDARVVVASVDTYLRFAEAVNRLDLAESGNSQGLPQMISTMQEGGARSKTRGVLQGAGETVKEKLGRGGEKKSPAKREEDGA